MMRMRWLWAGALVLLLVALAVAGAVIWTRSPLLLDDVGEPTPTSAVAALGDPSIQLSPDSGDAGTRVTVQGTGWPADTMVIVVLEDDAGRSGVLAASTTDAQGALRTGFTYPVSDRWLQPGVQTVVAHTTDDAVEVSTTFTVNPPVNPSATLTASPPVTETVIAASPTSPITQTPRSTPTPSPTSAPTLLVVQGWRGDYWNNPNLEGEPALIRDDPSVQFDWGLSSPAHAVQADNFSARWTRTVDFAGGLYRFSLEVDDGARLYIDDQLVLDAWQSGARRTAAVEQTLTPGLHRLRVDYFEQDGAASIRLDWQRLEPTVTPTPLSTSTPIATLTPTPLPTATPTVTTTPTPTGPATIPPATATSVAFAARVAQGRDDAEQGANGRVKHDSDELDMVEHEETGEAQIVGIRFQNVAIPRGVQITAAYLVFTAEENADRPTTLFFQGEAAGDSARFSSGRNNIGARPRTAASVDWPDIPPWMTPGETHTTPDLAPVVQEIVNRADWQTGNALTFLITGSGQRLAEAYDGMPDAAPLLYVEYVE